jgi:hypothetical protein
MSYPSSGKFSQSKFSVTLSAFIQSVLVRSAFLAFFSRFAVSFFFHFPRSSFFSSLLKPINAKPIITKPQFRETLQESGNTFHLMHWTLTSERTNLSFINRNAFASIHRESEPDYIKTDETDFAKTQPERTENLKCPGNDDGCERRKGKCTGINFPS